MSAVSAPIELISSAEDLKRLAGVLAKEKAFAFDTEFVRENTFYPITELIQIATRTQVWLVDGQVLKAGFKPGPQGGCSEAIAPLREVFENQNILKIAHAAGSDQECLYTSYGFFARPCLDTATAASLLGLGDSVGLSKLLKTVLGVELKKGHARSNWSVRPLPQPLLEYAAQDVEFLVELGERLLADLEKLGRREWAMRLSAAFEDARLYEPTPEDLALRLGRGGRLDAKSLSVLRQLVQWRETRVRELNLPRRWVAEDKILVDLAVVKPKDLGGLESFRGLNRGEIKNGGKRILDAVQRGLAEVWVPESRARSRAQDLPSPEEQQLLSLLQCFIGILADQNKLSAKHVLTSSELLRFYRLVKEKAIESPQVLVEEGLLDPECAELMGSELIAFLRGERALRVVVNSKRSSVEVVAHSS